MNSITLFEKNSISVKLKDIYFDDSIEGSVALLQVINETNDYICIDLCNIRTYGTINRVWSKDSGYPLLSKIPPHSKIEKKVLNLAGDDEKEEILQFQKGYIHEVCCQLSVYSDYSNPHNHFYGKGQPISIKRCSMSGVSVSKATSFEIENDELGFFATSDYYIPFELSEQATEKNEQILLLKQKIKEQLSELNIGIGETLLAQYGETGKPRFFDVENLCIYNIGTSAFSNCCKTNIAFMELSDEEATDACAWYGLIPKRTYHYKYSVLNQEQLSALCNTKRKLAIWNNITINSAIPHSPLRYWECMRREYEKITICSQLDNPKTQNFGMRVTLHTPNHSYPASVMKGLLDGLVCAFHSKENNEKVLKNIKNMA